MDPYYLFDECVKCNKKACVVVYAYELQAEVFVWHCPSCKYENQLPIANIAAPVTWDQVKDKDR